jgi:hypothetical protein
MIVVIGVFFKAQLPAFTPNKGFGILMEFATFFLGK